ncbi:MAG TPA: glycosyltransferase family 39 protein, partial [Anaerolineae bacterium]|nr:glycosyltransferase family 39 protein [Anaerolineae bacterium]
TEFFTDTTSPSVDGFYSVAVTTPDLLAQLPHYAEFMRTLPIHPQTHPPGLVVLHWLTWQGFETLPDLANSLAIPLRTLQCQNAALMSLDNAQIASAIVGMIVPVIGGFAVWPLYALGRRLIGARQAALAAAIFLLLPMFVMWPAEWDQVYPLLLLASLYFIHTGLEARSTWRFMAAGLMLSIATFMSIGNMVMAVIAVVYMIVWWFMSVPRREIFKRESVQHWTGQFFALITGCAVIWVIYVIAYRVPLSDILTVGERLLLEGTRCPICPSTHRTYGLWVIWNVVDFALFLSLPIVILLLVRLPALLKKSYLAVRWGQAVAWVPLAVAALSVFVVLDVAGITRGEVSRLWAYFGPLFVLLALVPAKMQWTLKRGGLAVLLGLIALQVFSMNTRWDTYPSYMDEPPAREANFVTPRPQLPANIDFAQQIKLVGADLNIGASDLGLNLYWQALTQPEHAYTVFVHVLDEQGNLIAQQDNMPVHDQLLTSCWQPGEQVTDPYTVALSAQAAQRASVEIGLYRLDTGERLPRDDGAGTTWSIELPLQ